MNFNEADKIVEEVFSLYTDYGNEDYIGENVSQLEHMCQAAQLAELKGYDSELTLAAFFHDIGHLCEHIMDVDSMNSFGVVDHETIGMNYLLEKGFSRRIALIVKSHVDAKRYLTFSNPDYYKRLSKASKETLALQGGMMTAEEAKLFEADPLFEDYIKLRLLDDLAKVENQTIPDLKYYKVLALHHLVK
jgi:2-amino-1-hydroxyethylphosphonate dioxygenase (glycine-forming)